MGTPADKREWLNALEAAQAYHGSKPADEMSEHEVKWLPWAEKRIAELREELKS
jgi:hypothetical protein